MARPSAPEPGVRSSTRATRLIGPIIALRVAAALVVLVTMAQASQRSTAVAVVGAATAQALVDARARRVRAAAAVQQTHRAREEARAEERARLARDLHDSVAASLTGLALQADALCTRLGREDHPLTAAAASVQAAARQAADESRQLLTALRAAFGPSVAAEELALAVQEAVRNAAAHAPGATITVASDHRADGHLEVVVRDDGPGFDPVHRLPAAASDGHFGVLGMTERVRRLGGTCDLVTAPGTGTTVVIRVPDGPEGWAA